jgi:glutathione S-transferase
MSPSELEAYFDNTPEQTEKGAWRARKRELVELGFDASGVAAKFRLYRRQLDEMERALRDTDWLAGPEFSLADVALTPYVNRLAMLQMQGLWEGGRLPRVAQWFERIRSRPTFRPALLDWCPPELTADLRTYGAESWPVVRKMLEI